MPLLPYLPGDTHPPVIALMGSPRRGGNTDLLLDAVLEGVRSGGAKAEKILVGELKVSPCLEITQCMKDGQCPIRDDMPGLIEKLGRARAVILASPIFFYGPSAQLKAVIDRCQAVWARKYVLGMPIGAGGRGYLVSAAASGGKKLFDGLLLTARYFFDVFDMPLAGRVLVSGVDEKSAVLKRPEVLAEARLLGETLARDLFDPMVEGD